MLVAHNHLVAREARLKGVRCGQASTLPQARVSVGWGCPKQKARWRMEALPLPASSYLSQFFSVILICLSPDSA